MASAKEKLKAYFLQHVGEEISRETLREVAGNIQDWQRSLRQLRQEIGYCFHFKRIYTYIRCACSRTSN